MRYYISSILGHMCIPRSGFRNPRDTFLDFIISVFLSASPKTSMELQDFWQFVNNPSPNQVETQEPANTFLPEDCWRWERVEPKTKDSYTPRTGHAVIVWNNKVAREI